jgi:HK97 gp10 family phage protein
VIKVTVSGGAKLAAQLRSMSPRRERTALSKMLLKAAEPIRSRASELAPVEEGKPDLREHIIAKAVNDKSLGQTDAYGMRDRQETESVVAIGPQREFFYGLYQEFGTVRHGAQPFMRPAFDHGQMSAFKTLQDEIWAWLRKHADSSASTTGRNL